MGDRLVKACIWGAGWFLVALVGSGLLWLVGFALDNPVVLSVIALLVLALFVVAVVGAFLSERR